ncbi:MAG: hypothetical protein ACF8AM_05720 [Rhodopirellula sp. JB055]|uniref:hypothetical protein n=1 Tax=Rhodopirellula sp. JB055 TaxID=3342846 RepID=UPI00370B8EE2
MIACVCWGSLRHPINASEMQRDPIRNPLWLLHHPDGEHRLRQYRLRQHRRLSRGSLRVVAESASKNATRLESRWGVTQGEAATRLTWSRSDRLAASAVGQPGK